MLTIIAASWGSVSVAAALWAGLAMRNADRRDQARQADEALLQRLGGC